MPDQESAVVHVDESGNTGENLWDADNPVFTFAGVRLGDTEAADLIARVASRLKWSGTELKSKALLRNQHQSVLVEELSALPEGSIFTFLAHKQYSAVAKIVDLLVVELAHKTGYNMYADGSARGLANLFFYVGPVAGDRDKWTNMLGTFVKFAWGKEDTPPTVFLAAVDEYVASLAPDMREPFDLLQLVHEESYEWWYERGSGEHDDDLDPALPGLYAFCLAVGERVGPFKLIHDESAVIKRHATLLLAAGDLPNLVDPNQKTLALPVTDLVFADSASCPQIQIADWCAAATRRLGLVLADPTSKRLRPELEQLVQTWLVSDMWPSPPMAE